MTVPYYVSEDNQRAKCRLMDAAIQYVEAQRSIDPRVVNPAYNELLDAARLFARTEIEALR